MTKERAIEALHIALPCRAHLFKGVRVAADRPLAKDDHASCEDVRALDRDADWHPVVCAPERVAGAETDPRAAGDVHRVVDDDSRL